MEKGSRRSIGKNRRSLPEAWEEPSGSNVLEKENDGIE